MKRLFYCLCVLVLIGKQNIAFAQNDSLPPTWSVAFVPQHLLLDGLRIEVEKIIKPNHRLTFTPTLYYGSTNRYSNFRTANIPTSLRSQTETKPDRVSGGGLEVLHKYSPSFLQDKHDIPYIAYGLGLYHIQLDYNAFDWQLSQKGNLFLYDMVYGSEKDRITRIDGILLIGIKTFLSKKNVFFMDFSVGASLRKSFVNSTFSTTSVQEDGTEEYVYFGYGGNQVLARVSFSFGMMLF